MTYHDPFLAQHSFIGCCSWLTLAFHSLNPQLSSMEPVINRNWPPRILPTYKPQPISDISPGAAARKTSHEISWIQCNKRHTRQRLLLTFQAELIEFSSSHYITVLLILTGASDKYIVTFPRTWSSNDPWNINWPPGHMSQHLEWEWMALFTWPITAMSSADTPNWILRLRSLRFQLDRSRQMRSQQLRKNLTSIPEGHDNRGRTKPYRRGWQTQWHWP